MSTFLGLDNCQTPGHRTFETKQKQTNSDQNHVQQISKMFYMMYLCVGGVG